VLCCGRIVSESWGFSWIATTQGKISCWLCKQEMCEHPVTGVVLPHPGLAIRNFKNESSIKISIII
jgi:hypothetical protein